MPAPRALVAALLTLTALAAGASTAAAQATPGIPRSSPLVALLGDHTARAQPRPHARVVGSLTDYRPITGQRTVVPLLKTVTQKDGTPTWYEVRLPGRPNGHTGWIAAGLTRVTSTPWRIVVDIAARDVTVYKAGHRVRTYRAVVGKASTPTPHGRFFVEETVRMPAHSEGAPWALATSARSDVLEHFEGGVGQVAIHGTGNLVGEPGQAVSHGCVRLRPAAVTWLAKRIGPGVPIVMT